MARTAAKILDVLRRFESFVAATAYLVTALLLMGDILGRELLGEGIYGAQKMAVYAAIVAGFIGLSLATDAGIHLRPAFLDTVFPDEYDRAVWRVADLVSCAIYLTLGVIAVQFVIGTYEASDRAAVLYWLLWPIQCVIPYALFTTATRHGIYAAYPALRPKSEAS